MGATVKKAVFDPQKAIVGIGYPAPHDARCKGRKSWPLTREFGLTQFGANRVELLPGAWSTQRHWHKTNDELVVVLEGRLTLVTDDGEEEVGPGDCVAFRMNEPNAHHFQNRTDSVAVYYDIGGRDLLDVTTFPEMGVQAKPRVEITFKAIKS
jgi:uncharacterized cupin superfamily protein